jgi:hypothetical protein
METKYKIITNKQELKKLIQCCKQTGYASVDFETNAEPLYNKSFKPTILSVTFQPGFGCSIPLDHFETKAYTSPGWNWKKMLRKFGEEVIENYEITKVAWNWKFDDQVNQKYHIFYRGTCLDGMLAKYVLNEEKPHDLKSMVRRYLPEYGNYEKQDAFDKIPWDKKELDPLCHYGCQDTDYTLRLMLFFEKKLIDLRVKSMGENLRPADVFDDYAKENLYSGFLNTDLLKYVRSIMVYDTQNTKYFRAPKSGDLIKITDTQPFIRKDKKWVEVIDETDIMEQELEEIDYSTILYYENMLQ